MSMDANQNGLRIGTATSTAPTAGGAAPAAVDGAQFRRLLETLERLAKEPPAQPPVDDAAGLQDAMRRATDDFTTAMDLRRQLEAAFRARQV